MSTQLNFTSQINYFPLFQVLEITEEDVGTKSDEKEREKEIEKEFLFQHGNTTDNVRKYKIMYNNSNIHNNNNNNNNNYDSNNDNNK